MTQRKYITAPRVNAMSPQGVIDRPFTCGALYFANMEEWRDVPGYEGFYQVSSIGNVRSLGRIVESKNQHGQTDMRVQERILSPGRNSDGYLSVVLYGNDGKVSAKVHKLVAGAFIPNPMGRPQINHIDGVKAHNWVNNLEWVTASENLKHAYRIGLAITCNGNAKLTTSQVIEIRRLYEIEGMMQADIARLFNIYKTLVHKIVHNIIWKNI